MSLFRVSGWFVNHEFKHSGHVELAVERDSAPAEDEAERMLWALSDAQLEHWHPGQSGGLWRNEFTSVAVRDQPRLGVSGALGGLVADRLAHLAAALVERDIDVLLVSDENPEECRRRVGAARDGGVAHIVCVSFCGASPESIEQEVRESGMAFTILRANVLVDTLVQLADAAGVIRGPAGDGRVAAVARVDVVEVAAAVLDDPARHVGMTYTLTGSEALTLAEFAARASAALGRPLSYDNATTGDREDVFLAIADGSCAEVTDDIKTIRAWRARTLEEALRP